MFVWHITTNICPTLHPPLVWGKVRGDCDVFFNEYAGKKTFTLFSSSFFFKSGVIVYMLKKMNEVLIFFLQLCYM